MMIWFTADTHFGHRKIIEYCERPFEPSREGLEQMDAELIRRWNARVAPSDTVWHLGDFAFNDRAAPNYFNQLNGKKHLIWGNHDSDFVKHQLPWVSSSAYAEIRIAGDLVILCHYKFHVFNRSHRGAVQLYGHSHNTLPGNNQQIDVGVDCFGYKPITYAEAKKAMSLMHPYRDVDHHTSA